GAFTGAINDRIGKFEKADKGSIFLDEIGDLPDELQSKLLRVLQEQVIEQLGTGIEKKIDIRVITATNKDLYKQIKNGKFREDLYYRIAVVPITLPSLRERKEDIPLLVTHFLDKFAAGKNVKFDLNVIDALQSYDWPGNIRELENLIERVLVFLQNDSITLKDIPDFIFKTDKNEINTVFDVDGSLDGIQKEAIVNALKKSDGNKSKAARNLNIPRHVLLYKIKKYNIR
ncbi:MAG: sigma-54-dependent Fis family transcriptional regulator, partial [Calditrichia bacterium]|nr:sigma-54-dependent Fis family transcriptional regulator [Calditrichia bacterium]